MEENFNSGDTVLIASQRELKKILEKFSPTLECIKPLTIEEIADQYATILDVVFPPSHASIEVTNFAVLILDDGRDLVLPLQAIQKMTVQIQEADDDDDGVNNPNSHVPISKSDPNILSKDLFIVQNIAAESIQSAYR